MELFGVYRKCWRNGTHQFWRKLMHHHLFFCFNVRWRPGQFKRLPVLDACSKKENAEYKLCIQASVPRSASHCGTMESYMKYGWIWNFRVTPFVREFAVNEIDQGRLWTFPFLVKISSINIRRMWIAKSQRGPAFWICTTRGLCKGCALHRGLSWNAETEGHMKNSKTTVL